MPRARGIGMLSHHWRRAGLRQGKTMQDIRHMEASRAYFVRVNELRSAVRALESDVEMALIDATRAHWGNVGDLSRALAMVDELRALLRGTECTSTT